MFSSRIRRLIWAVGAVALVVWLGSIALAVRSLATECPAGAQSCKVLVLTPQEESILIQERGILATAAEGRKIELEAATMYFRNRIQNAPAGEVKLSEPK